MGARVFLVWLVALSIASASPAARYPHDSGKTGFVDSPVSLVISGLPNASALSKRWDGSPAMGQELAIANGKACALWSMMHLVDAKAGQLFNPPRALAHSDYLQLDGMIFQCFIFTN